MGGRGGSSGIGNNRKSYGEYRINISDMPDLSGSEKQINWANSIREQAIDTINNNIDNSLNKERENPSIKGFFEPRIRAYEYIGKQLEKSLKSITKASVIIDNREKLSSSRINQLTNQVEDRYRKERINEETKKRKKK